MHITSIEEKRWIQQRIKSGRVIFNSEKKKCLLSELATAEGPERYLGAKLSGAKCFLLKGGDTLILMLKEMIRHAGDSDTRETVLGTVHRGHLNMLVNVLGKKSQDLFDEFTGKHKEHFGMGDMKYHMGFSSDSQTDGGLIHLALAFNPSHLEAVSPVVTGSVCARLNRLGEPSNNKVLPITIHGDVVVAGQDVVQGTLSMSKARGYEVGDTVYIVVDGQVGSTTSNLLDACSTLYCISTDKMVQAPIFHINADDSEAVAFVTCLTLDFRNIFKRDVFIDLACYRHHGHNEVDEPSITQLLMYQRIKKYPTSCKIYVDKLEQEEIAALEDATKIVSLYRDALGASDRVVTEWCPMNMHSFTWSSYLNHEQDEEYPDKVEMKRLQEPAKCIGMVPGAVEIQSHVAKAYGDRQAMVAGEKLSGWDGAGDLAYATLADEDIPVRLPGEDSGRGTFLRRHVVIHNQSNDPTCTSLQYIHNGQGAFHVWNSVLSEEAVLALEYGYAITGPRTLTVWETWLGDFIDGAQVVIDQFISSGEQKWGRMRGLMILLLHGYEGQRPEHPSACPERYP